MTSLLARRSRARVFMWQLQNCRTLVFTSDSHTRSAYSHYALPLVPFVVSATAMCRCVKFSLQDLEITDRQLVVDAYCAYIYNL